MEQRSSVEPIAVVGATGHTGRFVVDELTRRKRPAIVVGRDAERLAVVARASVGGTARTASLGDAASLDRALRGAAAVVNCAGPFLDTALPVVEAAVRAGMPYLDVTAEQGAVVAVHARAADAERAGVCLVPGAAFFGGLADLLATALVGPNGAAETIATAVLLDSWHPTPGTRATGARNTARRIVLREGILEPMPEPAPTGAWVFPGAGLREVTMLPFGEIVTVPRHLAVGSIASWFGVAALRDLRDPSTPPPEPSDARRRSAQTFVLDVVVRADGRTMRATASGRDIYAATAPIVVTAAERLLAQDRARFAGVRAPGEIGDARTFLASLTDGEAFAVRYENDVAFPLAPTIVDRR